MFNSVKDIMDAIVDFYEEKASKINQELDEYYIHDWSIWSEEFELEPEF